MIYRLNVESHYYNNVVVFEGPECADFQTLCGSLMDKAAIRTLNSYEDGWIGIGEIGDNLITLLEELGYKKIECENAYISGQCIIDELADVDEPLPSRESMNKIIKRNDDFRVNLYGKSNLL